MATYDARPSAFMQLTAVADWEAVFSSMGIRDGIDNSGGLGISNAMAPSLDTAGRNAVIQPGNCLIKGQLWRCDAAVSTPIPAASTQNRWDRLVIQYNRGATTSPAVVQPIVITGTPAGTPVEPPLTQTPTGLYQIPVCSWTSGSTGALTGLLDERTFINDIWHNVTLTGFGTVQVARYKLTPIPNMLFLEVEVQGASPASGTVVGTLPAPYVPANAFSGRGGINLPLAGSNQLSTGQTPHLFLSQGTASSCSIAAWGCSNAGSYGGRWVIPMD